MLPVFTLFIALHKIVYTAAGPGRRPAAPLTFQVVLGGIPPAAPLHPLAEINRAIDEVRRDEVLRNVIVFPQ